METIQVELFDRNKLLRMTPLQNPITPFTWEMVWHSQQNKTVSQAALFFLQDCILYIFFTGMLLAVKVDTQRETVLHKY